MDLYINIPSIVNGIIKEPIYSVSSFIKTVYVKV